MERELDFEKTAMRVSTVSIVANFILYLSWRQA